MPTLKGQNPRSAIKSEQLSSKYKQRKR